MIKHIGPHRVSNLSVDKPEVGQLFDDGRKAAILYSDPPWGEGNVKYWATKATKDTGKTVEPITYEALCKAIFNLIAGYVTDHVFIETGFRFEQDMVQRMERVGLKRITRCQLVYAGKHGNVLLHGSFTGQGIDLGYLEGRTGAAVAELAIKPVARAGEIVFDPCCGMGYTARAALLNGMQFRGNELNPVRLEKTIKRLSGKSRG